MQLHLRKREGERDGQRRGQVEHELRGRESRRCQRRRCVRLATFVGDLVMFTQV